MYKELLVSFYKWQVVRVKLQKLLQKLLLPYAISVESIERNSKCFTTAAEVRSAFDKVAHIWNKEEKEGHDVNLETSRTSHHAIFKSLLAN